MRLKKVKLTEFRRFTELTVENIPVSTRLIILAGPNGCGKSSFLDALSIWYQRHSKKSYNRNDNYLVKQSAHKDVNTRNKIYSTIVEFHEGELTNQNEVRKSVYVRSAYRNDPELNIQSIEAVGKMIDEKNNSLMIYNDQTVGKNYERLVGNAIKELFTDQGDGDKSRKEIRKDLIGNIQDKFHKLFPNIELVSLGNPSEKGTFLFNKGTCNGFEYLNLSSGEKAAFDLILDLVISLQEFDDTVYCIDEPESHINPKIQADLLSVLYDSIPPKCQLVLATHSIGMMRRAQEIEKKNPGSVVFFDFELDFDQPQILNPIVPDRAFWNRAYEVALDDLAALVAPRTVVICESEPRTSKLVRNHSHDARCYEAIFQDEYSETRFVSMGGDQEIIDDKRGLAETLGLLINGLEIIRLVDRDDRTNSLRKEYAEMGIRSLSRRNLESYLFDEEVLITLAKSNDKSDKIEELIDEIEKIKIDKQISPPDDMKKIGREIFDACRKILKLTQCGNDKEEFMRETLAPLIKPGMNVYKELKDDIFGQETN